MALTGSKYLIPYVRLFLDISIQKTSSVIRASIPHPLSPVCYMKQPEVSRYYISWAFCRIAVFVIYLCEIVKVAFNYLKDSHLRSKCMHTTHNSRWNPPKQLSDMRRSKSIYPPIRKVLILVTNVTHPYLGMYYPQELSMSLNSHWWINITGHLHFP